MSTHGSIGPFVVGREDWVSYTERLEQYFAANDVEDAVKQRAILLSSCGADTYQVIRNVVAPGKPTDKTFSELVELVTAYYCPKPSVIAQRYAFHQRSQKEGEATAEFVAELRKLSEHCKFEASLDDMMRDRLVCGLRDSRLQRRLLAETDLTFKKAFQMCQATELAEKNAQELQTGPKSSQKVGGANVMALHADVAGRRHPTPQECYRCKSTQHLAKECRFKAANCHACGKQGHIAKACRSKVKNLSKTKGGKKHSQGSSQHAHQLSVEDSQGEEESYALFKLSSPRAEPIHVTMTMDEAEVTMEVDTGASISVMSEHTFRDTWKGNGPQLQTSTVRVKTYSGEALEVLGSIVVDVLYEGQRESLQLQIVAGDGPTLLGRDWLLKLRLNWPAICHISDLQTLERVLDRHNAVFKDELGKVEGMTAKIHIDPQASPRFCKPRTVPYALRGRVEQELDRLERDGIITPVEFSEWAAPIVPVVKTDGSIRICGDYKVTVNQAAKVDTYPLPRVEELFASLAGGKKFTTLDLAHAYEQITLEEESKKFVCINTHKGLYAYNRLPFGVASAPSIFQRTMEGILQGIDHVSIYIDDILITGRSEREHLQRLDEVLTRLETAGMRLRKSKCAFMQSAVDYLGHRIAGDGLHPTPDKIRAITEAPAPTNVQQLRAFLGLVNYYAKFLPNLSSVLAPLYRLLQKDSKWSWGRVEDSAFQEAKSGLTSSSVLTHYDPSKELFLDCDASPYGVGAVLSHRMEDGSRKPIAYASRSLNPAEKRYSQLDKEGLAIVFGVKKFHYYLYGRKFTIHSDHKPLQHLFSESRPIPQLASARIQRWALTLSAYDYTIVYRPGTEMANADSLSRLPLPDTPVSVPLPGETILLMETLHTSPISSEQLKNWSARDPVLSRVLETVRMGWQHLEGVEFKHYNSRGEELSVQDGCLLWGNRLVIPETARQRVLDELHAGHPGVSRMKSIARSVVWWPGIDAEIVTKVQGCSECQMNQKSPAAAPMHPWEWPSRPWVRIHVDYAGPFLGKMFLVVVDAHSKWMEVEVVPAATSAHTIQKLRAMFATHGLPELLVSDNGTVFTSAEFQEFLSRNGVRHLTAAPYHPSSNGLAERAVQTFKDSMKKVSDDVQKQLSRFLFHYRSTPHTTTGLTPAEMLMGRRLRTHLDVMRPDIAARVRARQVRQKAQHDAHTKERSFSEGESVFVRNFAPGQKWLAGTIVSINGQSLLMVELTDGRTVRRHVDHIQSRYVSPSVVSNGDELLDLPMPTDSSADEELPVETPVAETVHVPRRSTRDRRPPNRFTFDTGVN